jgi:general secretion pathway protein E
VASTSNTKDPKPVAAKPRFQFARNKRVGLDQILTALLAERLIKPVEANRIRSEASGDQKVEIHPLVIVANRELTVPGRKQQPLDLELLTRWLARHAGLPFFRVDPMHADVEAITRLVSQAYAQLHRILPVAIESDHALIATSEPFMLDWVDDLAQILKKEIQVVVANPLDVARFLQEFYGVSRSVRKAVDAKMIADGNKVLNFEQLLELGAAGGLQADDQHVIYIVDWLLQFAFEQRASDIHLEPRRESSNVRFRIDGDLHNIYQMPTAVMTAVTSRIKILGRMDVAEKRRPQDGRIKTRTPSGQEIELRLSTMPTAFGEKCVMRIFDPEVVARSFTELGLAESEVQKWREMVERPNGIVLVTGPTGSGKTTTLYSTLKHLARPELNICTVEDPIEMVSPDFNQMQVQTSIGVDFAQGVRTLLRQDPDIIMVGEIRDLETARMAVQASLTGHLVLSTLHTNDAPSAVVRLLDLGIPHYLLKGVLAGVVAQRLLRTLCPKCKSDGELDDASWRRLVEGRAIRKPQRVKRPVGCDHCRKTGYYGRSAIYEMLNINSEIAEAFNSDLDLAELTQAAYKGGMLPLRMAGARKVGQGLTTLEEVNRVIPPTVVG